MDKLQIATHIIASMVSGMADGRFSQEACRGMAVIALDLAEVLLRENERRHGGPLDPDRLKEKFMGGSR